MMQVSGGGIDEKYDIVNGEFDLIKTAKRELKEELNLDLDDKEQIESYNFEYIEKPEGKRHSYCVILKAYSMYTKNQLEEHFNKYYQFLEETDGEKEFKNLHFLKLGRAVKELDKLDNPKRLYVRQLLEIEDKGVLNNE